MTPDKDDKPKRVKFRDMSVVPEWPETVVRAQAFKAYEIGGRQYDRIPYGEELSFAPRQRPCGDCSAIHGELHVPTCDREECPKCRGQVIGCDCDINQEPFEAFA